jgi:hypothetical protein
MSKPIQTTLGELVEALFEAHLELYGDEEMAELATADLVHQMLDEAARATEESEAA